MDRILLPIKIKTRNEIDKMHWADKPKLKNEYKILIRNQMRLNNIQKIDSGKVKLSITSYRKRLLDQDNLIGGCKQLIDGLTDEGFIVDDDPDHLCLSVKQYKHSQEVTLIERIIMNE